MSGTLYLIPTPLGETAIAEEFSGAFLKQVHALDYFIVENAKTARAFLKRVAMPRAIAELQIETIAGDGNAASLHDLLEPLLRGRDAGLMSEAGAPAVADPGARLVALAHQQNIRVLPLVGPSAILLALMASGLNGQAFAFHGYLPVDEASLQKTLLSLEAESRRNKQTQIFIETPYRNDRLLRVIAQSCSPEALLCIATQLTQPDETVLTKRIADWKSAMPLIGKRPTVFLLQASSGD